MEIRRLRETGAAAAEPTPAAARRWSFGAAVFDERAMRLFIGQRPIEIELKPLEVLRYLLARPGQAVGKDELVRAVWPGRIISDSALTSTIAKLREALGPEHGAVRTVHGFGYRLEAELHAAEATSAPSGQGVEGSPSAATPRPAAGRRTIATAALALAAAGGAWLYYSGPPGRPAAEPSVAVLPFANLSAEPDSVYFADGVHDAVITHLARIRQLKTISRTSVMAFRDTRHNLGEIGETLGVAYVVEGTVQRSGGRVRVTAQLISVAHDEHLWAESYERDVADLFGIQSEIARNVATNVHARLSDEEVDRIARQPTHDAEAYDLYLRALAIWRGPEILTRADIHEALDLLDRATRRDSQFALAYALAARFHCVRHVFLRDPAAGEQAARASQRSLELEPDLVEGLIARGTYLEWVPRDSDAALAMFERARELAPGNAEILLWIGANLVYRKRAEEAVLLNEKAALLDPMDPDVFLAYPGILRALRRYAEAERAYERALVLRHYPWSTVLEKAYTTFLRTGEMAPLADTFAKASREHRFDVHLNTRRFNVALFQRDYAAAAKIALQDEADDVFFAAGRQPISKHVFAAMAFMLAGDTAQSRAHARKGITSLEPLLQAEPPLHYARLFLAYARLALGQESAALAEGRRALADFRKVGDAATAFYGPATAFFAYAGEDATAFELLERGLRAPGGVHLQEIAHSPWFDRLRAHPRFVQLLAEAQSRTARIAGGAGHGQAPAADGAPLPQP